MVVVRRKTMMTVMTMMIMRTMIKLNMVVFIFRSVAWTINPCNPVPVPD